MRTLADFLCSKIPQLEQARKDGATLWCVDSNFPCEMEDDTTLVYMIKVGFGSESANPLIEAYEVRISITDATMTCVPRKGDF